MAGSGLPRFQDTFLRNVAASLSRRRKSLSHKGKLSISADAKDEFEWLTVAFESAGRLTVVLQVVEKNRAHVFVRSNRGRDRGKILARLEDMTVVDNSKLLVRALEETVSMIQGHQEGDLDLEAAWKDVRLRPVI